MKGSQEIADPSPAAGRRSSGRWRRALFWTLGFLVLLALLLVAALVYLNQVGLPAFAKERLAAHLRQRGWDVEFSRLRLGWNRGLVIDNLRLQRTNDPSGLQISLAEVQAHFNQQKLRDFAFELETFEIRSGRLSRLLIASNEPSRTAVLNDLNGELRVRQDGVLVLETLRGDFLGIQTELRGQLTNSAALARWRFPKRTARARGITADAWYRLLALAEEWQMFGRPTLVGYFEGDALHPDAISATLNFEVPAMHLSFARATNLVLRGRLAPAGKARGTAQAQVLLGFASLTAPWVSVSQLDASIRFPFSVTNPAPGTLQGRLVAERIQTKWADAQGLAVSLLADRRPQRGVLTNASLSLALQSLATPWGIARETEIEAGLSSPATNGSRLGAGLTVRLREPETKWARGREATLSASLHSTNGHWLPQRVTAELDVVRPTSKWGNAPGARFAMHARLPPVTNVAQLRLFQTRLPWADRLEDVLLNLTASADKVAASNLVIDGLLGSAQWRAPNLRLDANSALFGGKLSLNAAADTRTSEVMFNGESDFDFRGLLPALNTNGQRWLRKYSWGQAPKIEAHGRFIAPALTNGPTEWREAVLPSVALAGRFRVGPGAYRDVPFSSAESPFTLSNLIWHLPQLIARRPEGEVVADYVSNVSTREFQWKVDSRIDLRVLKPLAKSPRQERAFELFEFSQPPVVNAEIWGRWRDPESLGFVAGARATNFTFRGHAIQGAIGRLHYTNQFLSIIEPAIERPGRRSVTAGGVGIDFVARELYLTNAFGNLDPQVVAQVISPKAGKTMEPYQFADPPNVRVQGKVDLQKGRRQHDLRFEVAGGPFRWMDFRLEQVSSELHWLGQLLTLTNTQGEFYGGRIMGEALFDFAPVGWTDFAFRASVAEANLQRLVADLANRTNKLEGSLSGELVITNANTRDLKSWQGYGSLVLQDGLIWDIPVFGVFSPVLNAILPGIGNSRAREATAAFTITNSVIRTRHLDIRATAMGMQYQGTVDFDGRIQGRMEAELLRDTPGIGPIISKLFWPVTKVFEYRISGTLAEPKPEPLWVLPRIIFFPFQPIKTIKDLLPEEVAPPPESKTP